MLLQPVAEQLRGAAAQQAYGRIIDLAHHAVGVERQHRIVHAVQNGLVVVARDIDFLEQPRVFDGDGRLRREGAQAAFIGVAELAALAIQDLHDADLALAAGDDRHAQQALGAVAGMPLLVETRVGIGVGDDHRLAAGEYRAGHAEMAGEADLADGIALQHAREQLLGLGIVKEQRTAVGVQRLGDHFHQARKQYVEGKAVGDAIGDVGQRRGAPQLFGDPVEQPRLARIVEAAQQAIDILFLQVLFKDFANGFEADLHARGERKTHWLWMQAL